MKKGLIALLAIMILTIAASVFLPSVLSDAGDEKLLNQVQVADTEAKIGNMGAINMTLRGRLSFINGKNVLRTQMNRQMEVDDLVKIYYQEAEVWMERDMLFFSAEDVLSAVSDVQVVQNCYIDSENFQCVFTDSLILSFDISIGYDMPLKIEFEFDRDTAKLIAFYMTTMMDHQNQIEMLYSIISGNLAEQWPGYLFGDASEAEMFAEVSSGGIPSESETEQPLAIDGEDIKGFSLWYYDILSQSDSYWDSVDTYTVSYDSDLSYQFKLIYYDERIYQYTTSWSPFLN